jgi:hypothetical protein
MDQAQPVGFIASLSASSGRYCLPSSALPDGETSGSGRLVSLSTMASADFSAFTPPIAERGAAVSPPPPGSEISPGKDAVLPRTAAAFTCTTEPVDFAVLCQLIPSRRPSMRFLFIGSRFSPSLPPHGRSPFRGWLQLVFCLYGSYTGDLNPFWTASMLGAHKLTGANAGGQRQLAMRTHWAARVAQFWR